ncbi:MAG: S1 RNA-binding domain-containing protein, partial [Patescibacteria group bacterium]|nr:S1 RNA-binding domain-containing protein [Patescibacteria group bacterium]
MATEEKKLVPAEAGNQKDKNEESKLKQLLSNKTYLDIPSAGEIVKGKVVSVTKREIRIDIEGFRTGIVRGRELSDDPGLADVKPGDEIE